MVAAKGKLNMGLNRISEDSHTSRSVGVRNFKVFSENERVKDDTKSIRNSVSVRKGAALTSTSDNKGILNKENDKGRSGTSANTKVRRKALGDVSNISGNIPRNVVHDGSKSLKSVRSALLQRVSLGTVARTTDVSSRKSSTGKERKITSLGAVAVHPARKGSKDLASSSDDQWTKTKGRGLVSVAIPSRTSRNPPIPTRESLPVLKRVNQEDTSTSKPIVKMTLIGPNAKGTSKSKHLSSLNKSKTVAASKKKEKVVRSSPPENIALVVSDETTQGKPLIDGNTNPSTDSSDNIARRKSDRRRTYTSLLMARSKFIEDQGEVIEQEKLPSIDDDCNQLEVAEYVDEIYQYYWVIEAQNPPQENYMSIQTDITPQMRGILINWLIEVHFKFELMPETLYLMVTLLDQYLSQVKIKKNEMQLVGLTALLLASKYEDFWHPRIKDLISISAEAYTRVQMLGLEKLMLKTLKFRLNLPTPYVFMLRFLKAAQSDTKLEHLAFYLIELSLVEYEALKFKSSLLCASAIYVARCTLQMTPAWTSLLVKHARYDVPQIRDCAEVILKFHKDAKKGQLKVTYEKYMKPRLSCVAGIKPLDRLPL
ncbi:putative cyclin-B3-1 [Pistacia vera]|uniref:putative cyclin-B3-1 n=1 Tax=Pistacia vera TaxID=55513 RepID=UPI001262EDEB|nr:putative cyclin-B3-1 [Pistacia vera]